jgi:hypothetical protein
MCLPKEGEHADSPLHSAKVLQRFYPAEQRRVWKAAYRKRLCNSDQPETFILTKQYPE